MKPAPDSLPCKPKNHTSYKHALYKIWHLAYLDKKAFGQASIQLSQQDVLRICENTQTTPDTAAYVIPVQPSLPLSPSNAMLVNKLQRRFLLALWKLEKDEDIYRKCAKCF